MTVCTLLAIFLMGCPGPTDDPAASSTPQSTSTPTAVAGDPSPTFNLTAPDGSTVKFDPSDNPDNEAFLVLFWSYRWDPNVATLLERTSELHERYAPRGLVITAVSYDEEPTGLRKFLSQNPVPFEVAVGTDATYGNFEIESIPTAILVDSNGRVVDRWTGYFSTEELGERITPHLPGRSGNS